MICDDHEFVDDLGEADLQLGLFVVAIFLVVFVVL